MSKNNLSGSADKYICCHCGEPLALRNYYKSNSDFFFGVGHLPICKTCLGKLFNLYSLQYQDKRKAMQRICMTYDIYFESSLFESCINDGDEVIVGNYIKKLNLSQHKRKTFNDSIEEGFSFDGSKSLSPVLNDDKDSELRPDPKLVIKWGNGFPASDYVELESHYKMLKRNNPTSDNNQEIFIISLCHLYVLMMKAIKKNDLDGYAKANEQYSKTFTKAGLKTVQEVDMGSDDCWGEWVRRIEEYTPAEYYKNKELFKDFDNVGDYFKRFVLRPLRNLMHGTTDRDHEFCVKDGDEDEYTEPI